MATTGSRRAALRRTIGRVPGALAVWARVRQIHHQMTLRLARRRNHLYTQFCRVPAQLDALVGPVYAALAADLGEQPLRIIVFGSSTGAEPYSIAWALQRRLPHVRFHIDCYDIEPTMIAAATAARYSADEVFKNKLLPSDFVQTALDAVDGGFQVKAETTEPVSFCRGSVLDAALIARVAPGDVVFAQNFLFHLSRDEAAVALNHLTMLLKPTAALFIDGADLDIRSRGTEKAGLFPVAFELERIHAQALIERGDAWPEIYWGLEPFDRHREDRVRRYATVFLKTRPSDAGLRGGEPTTANRAP
jgi:chemotaxis methyl-accepting protein methylase